MQPPKSYSVGGQHSSRAAYRQARRHPTRLQESVVRVRLRSDRLSLIEECISQCQTAYKQSTKLLGLANLLRVAVTYTSYHHSPLEKFAEVLLRTGKLAETKSEGQNLFPATEVLLQLASDALNKDMTLALSYLLALPQVMDANRCFEKQSHSALSLQLAAYYYALQIYARLTPCFNDKCHTLYKLASDALNKDMTLALSYLLALPQVMDANRCFEKQSHSALSLQLAAYYYALQIYARLTPCFNDKCHTLYKANPKDLIKLVTKYVTENASADWPEELEKLIQQLHLYNGRLTDFTQAQVLQGLGRGVDVQRFSADSQYKRETILGLAELSTKEIEDRTQALGLFETLKSNPEAFHEHMTKYVYSSIEGTDLPRLLYYFSLLENCGCLDFVTSPIKPDTHIRLLKKLKAVATGLNYRRLTDEDSEPLEALAPVLTSQNVLSISKLASKIPRKDGCMLSSSSVHAAWLRKLFWKGDPQLTVEVRLEITKRALKSVKQISEKMRKKNSEDSSHLPENSPASFEEALNHLQQSVAHLETLNHDFILSLKNSDQELLQKYSNLYDLSRSEEKSVRELAVTMSIDGQPLDHIQQLLEVSSGPLHISPKSVVQDAVNRIVSTLGGGSPHGSVPRESAPGKVAHSGSHFHSLSRPPLPLLLLQGRGRRVTIPSDRTRSKWRSSGQQFPTKELPSQSCCMARLPRLSFLGSQGATSADWHQDDVLSIVSASEEVGEQKLALMPLIKSTTAILEVPWSTRGSLVSSDDLLDWLRPFCGNVSLPVKPRIEVLQILEQAFHLSDEDSKLLVFFRTQAVLKAIWPHRQVFVFCRGSLVSSDDLLDWLRPFCGNVSLPVKPRIEVLQILEQAFHLSDEDSKLLVFFRTQAVLKAIWPHRQLEISDVEKDEKRYQLFVELLNSSSSEVEFQHLVLLLQAWPPVKSETM
ncbi:UNVERIFIED_CONTAM: hypothetical protein FKN15_036300 [Acipenser sinensis]